MLLASLKIYKPHCDCLNRFLIHYYLELMFSETDLIVLK